MITKRKLKELRERIVNHKVSQDGRAVVELTAAELQLLIEIAEMVLETG